MGVNPYEKNVLKPLQTFLDFNFKYVHIYLFTRVLILRATFKFTKSLKVHPFR